MKSWDKILLAVFIVLVAAECGMLLMHRSAPAALTAEIAVDGKPVRSVSLKSGHAETFQVKTKWGFNMVKVENGSAAIISSDCSGHDCVRRGRLSRAGDSAVCLPHRLVITVGGAKKTDAVAY